MDRVLFGQQQQSVLYQVDPEDPVIWDWLRLYPPLQQYHLNHQVQRTAPVIPFQLRDLLGDWWHQQHPPASTPTPGSYLQAMAERMHQSCAGLHIQTQRHLHEEIRGWEAHATARLPGYFHALQQMYLQERQLWQQADFFGRNAQGQLRPEGIPLLHRPGQHKELLLITRRRSLALVPA